MQERKNHQRIIFNLMSLAIKMVNNRNGSIVEINHSVRPSRNCPAFINNDAITTPASRKALSIPFLTGLIYKNPALKGQYPPRSSRIPCLPERLSKKFGAISMLKTCFTSMMRLHNNLQYLQLTSLQT